LPICLYIQITPAAQPDGSSVHTTLTAAELRARFPSDGQSRGRRHESHDISKRDTGTGSAPKVLVFRGLYRATPMFDDPEEQKQFEVKVQRAFQKGTYRQES